MYFMIIVVKMITLNECELRIQIIQHIVNCLKMYCYNDDVSQCILVQHSTLHEAWFTI